MVFETDEFKDTEACSNLSFGDESVVVIGPENTEDKQMEVDDNETKTAAKGGYNPLLVDTHHDEFQSVRSSGSSSLSKLQQPPASRSMDVRLAAKAMRDLSLVRRDDIYMPFILADHFERVIGVDGLEKWRKDFFTDSNQVLWERVQKVSIF